jgi:hypothetical protein
MNEEQRVVFAVAAAPKPIIVLGVSQAAWEYMEDGHTHTFDLTKVGLPVRIIMFGGPDRAACEAWIAEHNKRLGVTDVIDRRAENLGIDTEEKTP